MSYLFRDRLGERSELVADPVFPLPDRPSIVCGRR